MRVVGGLKTIDALVMMVNVRSISLDVERELYGSVVVPFVLYVAETWGMWMDERQATCYGNEVCTEDV